MKIGRSDIKNKVFFSVLFAIVFFISCVFSQTLGTGGEIVAVSADLLFALSIITGILYENRRAASAIALVAGVVSDVFLTPPMHISPLLFFVGAYYSSKIAGVFTAVNAVTVSMASIPFFMLRSVVSCVYIISENKGANLAGVIRTTVLPELAVNVAAVFFSYIVVSFIYKKVKRRFFI